MGSSATFLFCFVSYLEITGAFLLPRGHPALIGWMIGWMVVGWMIGGCYVLRHSSLQVHTGYWYPSTFKGSVHTQTQNPKLVTTRPKSKRSVSKAPTPTPTNEQRSSRKEQACTPVTVYFKKKKKVVFSQKYHLNGVHSPKR